MAKTVYTLLHDGLADWEAAFILPVLREMQVPTKTFAARKDAVTTAGGLRVLPDVGLAGVDLDDAALVVLPGGESWNDATQNPEVMALLPEVRKRGVPIAAICAATVALARLGLLDDLRHTSNDLGYMKAMAPRYRGEARYDAKQLAVTDRGLITAAGIGALEFTREIMKLLAPDKAQFADEWFGMFKNAVVPAWAMAPADAASPPPACLT